MFYVLAIVQFVSFAYLKVKTNIDAWAGIVGYLICFFSPLHPYMHWHMV